MNPLTELAPLASIDGSTIINAVGAAAGAASDAASGAVSEGSKLIFGVSLTNAVVILLGLLLIAAGLFSFDKTRELIISGAKTGAALAA